MSLHPAIGQMLAKYNCKTKEDYKNALKEIVQEVALLGLARHHFFDKAAFYGGTALRMAHQLNRFSEDLDFEFVKPNKNFNFESYLKGIDEELSSFGLNMRSEKKIKTSTEIDSAFIKGSTLEHILLIEGIENAKSGINKNDVIKIKIEIDLNPPEQASTTEMIFHQYPFPFSYRILDLPSLFSGKIHAVLCREWKGGRIKGRDFYDFLWYAGIGVSPNLLYLESKMRQLGHWSGRQLTKEALITLLNQKFESLDWELAKKDVIPFIKDPFELSVWGKDFFKAIAKKIP